jgi:predicted alpha-1,2-mannosidase
MEQEMEMLKQPVDYVNPLIGSIGHLLTSTSAKVSLPYGSLQVAPIMTPGIKDNYWADRIFGFPAGFAAIMATKGKPKTELDRYASSFDHDVETVSPYYYSVLLEDYDIYTEYTVACHSVFYRFTFPAGQDSNIVVNLQQEAASFELVDDDKIMGYAWVSGVPRYLCMHFSKPLQFSNQGQAVEGLDALLTFTFATASNEQIAVKVGTSYISADQARKNLDKDIAGWDFDGAKTTARTIWNQALSKVEVEGGTDEQRTIFYTSLYRSLQQMTRITEDGKYYSGFDKQIHEVEGHDFYTSDNMWDSYRCLHPLQLLLEPQRQVEMIKSYLLMYEQSGWLPQFPDVSGDRNYMTGNHTAAMIADTAIKGYRDFDLEKAYAAMKKNAMEATMLPWVDAGPVTELDQVYLEKGFFPALRKGETEWVKEVNSFERRQAVSVTLEHAYDDWCIALIAKELDHLDDYQYFMNRAQNYRNLFDERIGFMAPKSADGKWVEDFDPKLGGGQGGRDYFAECNSWIYTFHVQHDIGGLIGLLGGQDKFVEKLDSLFTEQYDTSKYEFLNQFPDSTGLIGQYCHGNEPAFHIPYLYNYAGTPWKTQRKLREIMKIWYNAGPLGICGDEDAGAMSSWYVFSAMGLYPVCPGKAVYDIGSPVFSKIQLKQENGKFFTIQAIDVSEQNKYIQSAHLNGNTLDKPWVEHSAITAGGELVLQMGSRPNKMWGVTRQQFS